jgi:putative transcriptional regulator
MKNRIRELRQAQGWSMEQLGEKLKKSISAIARIEKGEAELAVEDMITIAKLFSVTWEDVIGLEQDVSSDATKLTPEEASLQLRVMPHDDDSYYAVTASVLDAIGVVAGDYIVVDTSDQARDRLQSLDAVVIHIKRGAGTVALLRQFVEPDMFITNAKGANAPAINRQTAAVDIAGTITRRIARCGDQVAATTKYKMPKVGKNIIDRLP